jgi:hypothetical protein
MRKVSGTYRSIRRCRHGNGKGIRRSARRWHWADCTRPRYPGDSGRINFAFCSVRMSADGKEDRVVGNERRRTLMVSIKNALVRTSESVDFRNAYALAGLRIAIGSLFLIFGQYKLFGLQFTLQGGFEGWINRFIQDGAYPFMAPVLRGFVLPHSTAPARDHSGCSFVHCCVTNGDNYSGQSEHAGLSCFT